MRNDTDKTDVEIEKAFSSNFSILIAEEDLTYTRETIGDFLESREGWYKMGQVLQHNDEILEVENFRTFQT